MNFRLSDDLAELDAYCTKVADATEIPAAFIEKDFWLTELLRAIAAWSARRKVEVVWKGGTALSKAYKLIQRFSEDVDVLIALSGDDLNANQRFLDDLVGACASEVGCEGERVADLSRHGRLCATRFRYPAAHSPGAGHSSGLLLEAGTLGGAIPKMTVTVRSVIAEYSEPLGLPLDFVEASPVTLDALAPSRTLVEKLMILHTAACIGNDDRQRLTARHYYDIAMLLDDDKVMQDLRSQSTAVLSREVEVHSRATGRSPEPRPVTGFAASPAFRPRENRIAKAAYDEVVIRRLLWPRATVLTFDECCARVHQHAADL